MWRLNPVRRFARSCIILEKPVRIALRGLRSGLCFGPVLVWSSSEQSQEEEDKTLSLSLGVLIRLVISHVVPATQSGVGDELVSGSQER